ncbi:MAG: zinc-ribbon domain-containing protein [Bacilli bacterium]|nr:zinc-ribbon domain-containing protein [Bacilli bacterium]
MYCPKCGNYVEDGAQFCNNCGLAQTPTTVSNNLIISRPGKLMGAAINITVNINGVETKIGAGDVVGFNLSPGMAVIKYKVWCRREKEVTINVVPGRNYSIIFKYDPLWGGFKIGKDSIIN